MNVGELRELIDGLADNMPVRVDAGIEDHLIEPDIEVEKVRNEKGYLYVLHPWTHSSWFDEPEIEQALVLR